MNGRNDGQMTMVNLICIEFRNSILEFLRTGHGSRDASQIFLRMLRNIFLSFNFQEFNFDETCDRNLILKLDGNDAFFNFDENLYGLNGGTPSKCWHAFCTYFCLTFDIYMSRIFTI